MCRVWRGLRLTSGEVRLHVNIVTSLLDSLECRCECERPRWFLSKKYYEINGTLLAGGDKLLTEDNRYTLQTFQNSTYFISNLTISDLENIFSRTDSNQTDVEDIGEDIIEESQEDEDPEVIKHEDHEYTEEEEEEGRFYAI